MNTEAMRGDGPQVAPDRSIPVWEGMANVELVPTPQKVDC